jgi:hypothetical protein
MVKKAVFFILVSLALGQAIAVGSVQQQKLTPSDGGSFDRSGWSVSISGAGNTSLVGTPYGDINGRIDQGSADVFVRKNGEWTQQQNLTSSDGASFDRFGWSVSISDDGITLVIGSPYSKINNRTEQGSAYVFSRSNGKWAQQRKLVASGGRTFDRLGWSVSISNVGTLLVGSPESNIGKNISKGSAYIFFSSIVPDLTMTEWSIIIFVLLAALGSGYYLGRKKRTNHQEVHK